jgi:hypothetical protein
MVAEPNPIQTSDALAIAGATDKTLGRTDGAASARDAKQGAQALLDPNVVIAAAFKAAGLPVPEMPNAPDGIATGVAPLPIIRAALRAAGLTRN